MAGQTGTYPRGRDHIAQSGLRISELSELSNVSEKSILRIRKSESVLDTTIRRVINALNQAHFNPQKSHAPIDFDREFVPDKNEK